MLTAGLVGHLTVGRAGVGVVEQGIRDALKWINGELQDNPEANVNLLIDRASQQFNLTPLQTDFLYREYARTGSRPASQ